MPKGKPDKGYALTPQREKVLRILAQAGGSLDDEAGLVVARLREQTGHESTQALSMVIKQLESSGLVKRDVAGRRTYHLELVESALAPEDAARLGLATNGRRSIATVEAREPIEELEDDVPPAPADGTDYRRLADELLKRCSEVLARKTGDATLKLRIAELEAALAEERDRARDLTDQLTQRGMEVLDLKEKLRIAERNLETVTKARDRQKAERGSDPIEKRLTDRERRELDDLKRVMESRPGR